MQVKSFHSTHYGHLLKLGRRRPVAHGPRLALAHYLLRSLPSPPASVDYAAKAARPLAQMYENDALGDCVIAGMAHVVGVLTANAGNPVALYSNTGITALYSAIGGYVPGDPSTDQGCDEVTALNYWLDEGTGAGLHKIAGYLQINPLDVAEVKTALWLFENLFFGLELPDAWLQDPRPGFTWGPGVPDPDNGHCVIGAGYGAAGVKIATWGMLGTITWPAIAQVLAPAYGGQLYVVISQDAISRAKAKSPVGLSWPQMERDFQVMGGALAA